MTEEEVYKKEKYVDDKKTLEAMWSVCSNKPFSGALFARWKRAYIELEAATFDIMKGKLVVEQTLEKWAAVGEKLQRSGRRVRREVGGGRRKTVREVEKLRWVEVPPGGGRLMLQDGEVLLARRLLQDAEHQSSLSLPASSPPVLTSPLPASSRKVGFVSRETMHRCTDVPREIVPRKQPASGCTAFSREMKILAAPTVSDAAIRTHKHT